jgi:hypothetical protein
MKIFKVAVIALKHALNEDILNCNVVRIYPPRDIAKQWHI